MDTWLDSFSLYFCLLLISSPLDGFLKRLTLLKILTILKETHRQVGKLKPRLQHYAK